MARLPTKKKGLAVIQVTVVAAADRERIIAIVRDHKAAEGAEILTGLDPVTFSVNFTEYNPATVFARQGDLWGACFHPELSGDLRIHHAFLSSI